MRTRDIFLSFALFLTMGSLPAVAQSSITFTPPPGWASEPGANSQGTTFTMPNLPAGKIAAISVLPEQTCSTGMHQCVETALEAMKQQFRGLGTFVAAQSKPLAGGGEMLATSGFINKSGMRFFSLLAATGQGRTLLPVVLLTNLSEPAELERVQKSLGQMLASVQFAGASQPSAGSNAPQATPGGLPGIWRAVAKSMGFNSYIDRVGYGYVTFFPDGTYLSGFPNAGLDGYNKPVQMRVFHHGLWGTYARAGDIIKVAVPVANPPDILTREYELRPDGTLVRKSEIYYKLNPCDGLRLNGSYRRGTGTRSTAWRAIPSRSRRTADSTIRVSAAPPTSRSTTTTAAHDPTMAAAAPALTPFARTHSR